MVAVALGSTELSNSCAVCLLFLRSDDRAVAVFEDGAVGSLSCVGLDVGGFDDGDSAFAGGGALADVGGGEAGAARNVSSSNQTGVVRKSPEAMPLRGVWSLKRKESPGCWARERLAAGAPGVARRVPPVAVSLSRTDLNRVGAIMRGATALLVERGPSRVGFFHDGCWGAEPEGAPPVLGRNQPSARPGHACRAPRMKSLEALPPNSVWQPEHRRAMQG